MVAQVSTQDLADRLIRAMAASAKVINSRPAIQVIEAPKADAGEPSPVSEVPDHSGPFAQNSKHRFRRL